MVSNLVGDQVAIDYDFSQPSFKPKNHQGGHHRQRPFRMSLETTERPCSRQENWKAQQGAQQAVNIFDPGMDRIEDCIIVPRVGCPMMGIESISACESGFGYPKRIVAKDHLALPVEGLRAPSYLRLFRGWND